MTLSVDHAGATLPSREELEAARSGSVVVPLSQRAVLKFSGQDAESFLQGQLTCDVASVGDAATYGAWCSPQGRMLASFLLWRSESALFMALARELAAGVQQRLGRYVLRAKVSIEPAALALVGCSGPDAPAALRATSPKLPERRLQVLSLAGDDAVIRLDESRFVVATEGGEATVAALPLERVTEGAWEWLDIRRGIPWIGTATQDRLVPQMANLERIGGVSFAKGCYTGQEIVARAQHRGTVKRRMFLAHVDAGCAAGDAVFADDLGDQAAGMIVNAAASPDGGTDALAVVNTTSREASLVHLRAIDGPILRFMPDPAP